MGLSLPLFLIQFTCIFAEQNISIPPSSSLEHGEYKDMSGPKWANPQHDQADAPTRVHLAPRWGTCASRQGQHIDDPFSLLSILQQDVNAGEKMSNRGSTDSRVIWV